MRFKPKLHQLEMIDHVMARDRLALFAFMGSGKTSSVLTGLLRAKTKYPILVVAPLRVAKYSWSDEAKKWDHLSHLKFSFIGGHNDQRFKGLIEPADIYTINYENLPWLVETLGKTWPFKTVVVDESTRLKGFRSRQGSLRAKALAKVAHTLVKKMILLTGTPAPNGLLDLWGQIWFLDKGERLLPSFTKFRDKYFDSDYMGYKFTPKKTAQKEIQDLISDLCITIKSEDYFDLEEPIVSVNEAILPTVAMKKYREMEKQMYTDFAMKGFEANSAAHKSMICRQMASGVIYTDKHWEVLHNEKLSVLESILNEHSDVPILVAYHFKSDVARLQDKFPQGKVLDGDSRTVDAWNRGEIPLLFIHPASGGLGLNLQNGGNVLVFYSCDWQAENHLQVIERIGPIRQMQAGLNRNVFLHYIVARDTIDEQIIESLREKKSMQEVLLAAMTKRGL